ncbi:hypothetical protein [Rheinheimera tangshanensis]|uniref:Uncharacterized protein n=1 Tax=Rheinheimera tangshanensis TaxID=400153 RepID=A0A5C8M410_9GAMM|nr:hypothetical protein [Rheinheimera tangshanensis]TXK83195.1 hypothetical protein FU839_02685 [Rheinheimera tangshanensis]GGM45506.1 hypothetical protein GCM10010920_02300 [Rheinheimera tangshanensis]
MSTQKVKIDIMLAICFVIFAMVYILSTRVEQSVESIDLTHSELACKKAYKPDKFRGVYILDGKEYYAHGTYTTCKEFFDIMQGKVITGKHVKSENLLIELRVGDRLYTDDSIGMKILTSIFLGLVLFAFLRSPIHWILNRFV